MKTCRQCGNDIVPGKRMKVYCSKECYKVYDGSARRSAADSHKRQREENSALKKVHQAANSNKRVPFQREFYEKVYEILKEEGKRTNFRMRDK